MAGRLGSIGKREKILLGALGVVALIAVLFLLLFSGGDTPTTPSGGGGRRLIPRRPTPATTATQTPGAQTPIDVVDTDGARDPFDSPLESPAPAPTGTGSPSPGATAVPTRSGTRVTLIDIFTRDGVRFASVQVGNEQHNVKEGDTFAGNYRVVSVTESCATFVMGDERFTLCIGQEVFK